MKTHRANTKDREMRFLMDRIMLAKPPNMSSNYPQLKIAARASLKAAVSGALFQLTAPIENGTLLQRVLNTWQFE